MDEALAAIEGVMRMLMEQHADAIDRLAVAQLGGKATRIWWDAEADIFRFEVIE